MSQSSTTSYSYALVPLPSPVGVITTTDNAILQSVWSTPITIDDNSTIDANPGAGGSITVQFLLANGTWANAFNQPYTSRFRGGVPPGVTSIRATAAGATASLAVTNIVTTTQVVSTTSGLMAGGTGLQVGGSAGLSAVTYNGSNQCTGFTINGIAYTVTYPDATHIVVTGADSSVKTITLDGSGRIISVVAS